MKSRWRTELEHLLLILALLALLGLAFGLALELVLAGLLAYALWMLHGLRRLERWLQQNGQAVAPEGQGYWGHVLDTLYRRQRDQQAQCLRLEQSFLHLQDSFRALADAVVILDAEAAINWMNPAAERLLGLRTDRDRGAPIGNLLRDPDFLAYFEAGAYAEPLLMESPRDARLQLEVRLTGFGQGNRLLFVRDVSRLQALERMRKDFVANVSHELKTPLTVIAGYVEALAMTPLADEPRWQKVLLQMQQQSQRMNRLLDDLLMLSRLESLPVSEPEPVALAALLREIGTELRAAWPAHDIRVECDETLRLLGHAGELHSAFSNLVGNACKYSGEAGAVRVHAMRAADGSLRVAVQDNGIGIEPQHIARLTERFYRVDDSRHSETGGTGLGLAIVKHVLIRHDAHLEIASQPGRGSTFTACFPARRILPT